MSHPDWERMTLVEVAHQAGYPDVNEETVWNLASEWLLPSHLVKTPEGEKIVRQRLLQLIYGIYP